MKLDKNSIKASFDAIASKWDYSGNFILIKNNEILHNELYGYQNRDNNVKTTKNTRYLLDSEHKFFISFAILIAITQKKLSFKDYINQYIPEFKNGGKITIENLLKGNSGLFDFYHSHLMIQFEANEQYKTLDEIKRVRKEKSVIYENRDFKSVLNIINDKELEYEPGKDNEGSKSNSILLVEILKRVTGQTPFEYLKSNIFDVLNMTSIKYGTDCDTLSFIEHNMTELISTPVDFEVDGIFSVTVDDLHKFIISITEQKFLSKSIWKKAIKYDKDGDAILFGNANGYYSATVSFLGFGMHLYYDFNKGIAFANIINEEQLFERADNSWNYFRKETRENVASLLTFPENTQMVKLAKKNFWSALSISIKDNQHQFVLDAKASIAMSLFYKTKVAFAQMEGDIVIGLLVLDIDKKKGNYNIDIVIIDKKFKNKGYGKLMIKWAVNYLREKGAKKLSIGVNRKNIAAKKVYMNAGFKPKSVYGGGMELQMKL